MATYTNLAILQGWLEISSIQVVSVDQIPAVVVNGWIYTTDNDGTDSFFSERHPVVISGRPAESILAIIRKLNDKYPKLSGIKMVHLPDTFSEDTPMLVNQQRPFVVAQGKLFTHDGESWVDLKHISLLGLPWGALDVLSDIEETMNREVRSLIKVLTPFEKSIISQALGLAVKAILALRPPGSNPK